MNVEACCPSLRAVETSRPCSNGRNKSPHSRVSNVIMRHNRAHFLNQRSPDDGDVGPLFEDEEIKTAGLANVQRGAMLFSAGRTTVTVHIVTVHIQCRGDPPACYKPPSDALTLPHPSRLDTKR